MRKRSTRIQVWVNQTEHGKLQQCIKETGLTQEALIRALINGYIPKSLPPFEYHTLIRELHAIGNNLNQLAARANTTGHIDTAVFQYEANRLRRAVQEIQEAVTAPERRAEFGNDCHLGCDRPP